MSNSTLYLTDELHNYLIQNSLREHPILTELRACTANLPTSEMQISPEQGQFMNLLVQLINAKNTIEVGVYTGYSSLSVALALPEDGRIIACDINAEWTQLAQEFWHKAGVAQKIDLRLAPAVETLDNLINEGQANSFDFAFIDADKLTYDVYYEKCLTLIRHGGLILIDNVFFHGDVLDAENTTRSAKVIHKLNQKLLKDARVDISMLPISDGITMVRKR